MLEVYITEFLQKFKIISIYDVKHVFDNIIATLCTAQLPWTLINHK